MIKRRIYFLLTVSLAPLLSGCLASFQTARTMPEGASRFYVAAEYQATDGALASTGSSTTTTTLTTEQRTTLDIGGRFGLSRKWDFGFRVSLPMLNFDFPDALIDLRYQLVLSGGFAMSFGMGIDYASPNFAVVDLRGHVISLVPALNFGYDFNKSFGLYISARDLTPAILALGVLNATLVTGSVLAGSFGIRVGDEYGILAEGTYLKSIATGGGDGFIVGLAVVFGTGPGIPIAGETNRRAENWKERQADKPVRERVSTQSVATRGGSRVLKVRSSGNLVLLSQPTNAPWGMNERVCVFKGTQSVVCGLITKTDQTGAVLKYTDANGAITPGLEAGLEGGETKKRARPQPDGAPEPTDDAAEPTIDDLP